MVEYVYNVENEKFRRVDNRGPSLPFNIIEARRIESMMNLGVKAPTILKKIDFVNEVTMTNLRTFMNNLEKGNIIGLDEDYPVPTGQFVEMENEVRIKNLEDRVKSLEDRMSELKSDCFISAFVGSGVSKRKTWKERLGL